MNTLYSKTMNPQEVIKILLVDDDDIDIMSFERTLKKADIQYELISCTYAAEALEILEYKRHKIDCIFLDYQLPGTDGLQLLKSIRQKNFEQPISIMTSHGDEKLAVEMMKSGAFDYFPKSDINPEKLARKIHSIINYLQIQTDKKKIEEDLDSHKMFLQAITESSPNIIFIYDLSLNKFTYFNRSLREDLGYKKTDVYSTPFSDLIHSDDKIKIKKHLNNLKNLPLQKTYEFEYRVKNEKNEWVWYLCRNIIFKQNENDTNKEILGTTTNINKQKQAEERSEKALEMAEKALEIKAEFLSNMSHEIRTPMNAIMGLSDIVLQQPLEHSVEDNLKSIKQSADNLLVIINDILDFSKIEAGKVKIENIKFNFIYQIEHIKKTMEFKAKNKNLDFRVNINKEIPKYLKGDPYRLNQVILNLCSNAIKFTQKGYVAIDIELKKLDNLKAEIYFSVTDTGIGISKEYQQEIFSSFTQADTNVTRQFGGTGLGLTITKQLIGLMGGQILIESTLGKGSKFYFNLTFEITDQSEELNDNKSHNEAEKSLKGLNILVLEDNVINQKVVSQILETWNCNYSIAENGFKGINLLKNNKYDLILMDLQMPQLDGFETTKAIRTGRAGINNLRVPIIALTADAFPETKNKVVEIGMNDLVSKPFNKGILNSKIFNLAMEFCPENLDIFK